MPYRFRHAICNEIFEDWPFTVACRAIRKAGYTGIEIAPFTLSPDPTGITAADRREYRQRIASEGLRFAGFHWLMAAPKGLHVTTPDSALRQKSWRHIRDLIDLCADLGPAGVMVFGSPAQRGSTGGSTPAEATRRYVEGLASVAPHALERGVTVLVEALPANQCDVVLTLGEAAGIVREIGSPAIQTMFDTHNAVDEVEPHAALVEKHFDAIRHVHVNETDGGHPGTGAYDFLPLLDVLRRRDYAGWVSVEAFHWKPGAERVARDSLAFLEARISELPS
jgi:D-psicose/D-tagatose/L-ribulose 3-epimerase